MVCTFQNFNFTFIIEYRLVKTQIWAWIPGEAEVVNIASLSWGVSEAVDLWCGTAFGHTLTVPSIHVAIRLWACPMVDLWCCVDYAPWQTYLLSVSMVYVVNHKDYGCGLHDKPILCGRVYGCRKSPLCCGCGLIYCCCPLGYYEFVSVVNSVLLIACGAVSLLFGIITRMLIFTKILCTGLMKRVLRWCGNAPFICVPWGIAFAEVFSISMMMIWKVRDLPLNAS